MTLQTSKGKLSPTYNELDRKIMALEYEKLLLLMSPQSKVESNIVITEKE